MSTVELRFSALPSHVRTARLVAAAVARRAGVDESVLDEVRLAVGEACSRAVSLHRRNCPAEPVTVTLIHDPDRFSVEVHDRVPTAEELGVPGLGPAADGIAAGAGEPVPETEFDPLSSAAGGGGVDPAQSGPAQSGVLAAVVAGGADTVPVPTLEREPVISGPEDPLFDEADDLLSESMGLAVISGLVDDLDVRSGQHGAVIRMSWPAGPGKGGADNGT
jgi:Histidine kinase-like ATPase domain